MSNHLSSFQKILKAQKLDGFIVTNPVNIFYLTGFRGVSLVERESILVFNLYPSKPWRSGATLIAPMLYQTEANQIRSSSLKVKIVRERDQMYQAAKKLTSRCQKVGFEEENLTFWEHQYFRGSTPKMVPKNNLIENLRIIKSKDEIEKIEKAQIISQRAFSSIVQTIEPGQTEEEIAEKLAKIIKSIGGQGLAFESIIASGPNSGLPHHVTGKRKITKKDVLLLDFGAKYQDYCADLTRVVFIGKPTDRLRNIFDQVLTAQQKAIGKITHGLKASDAFHLANNHFKKHKLHNSFTHGLGHGVGLDIHEAPYLRPTTDELLTENMVFSVEPGLYFPWGGIRIEDLVVIKNGKAKIIGKETSSIITI